MKMLRTVGSLVGSLPGRAALVALALMALPLRAFASELDLALPRLDTTYSLLGNPVSGHTLLLLGLVLGA